MITFVNCFKSAAQQCQVAERLIVVTEIIAVWPDYYPIAIMVFPHPWQSSIFIRFPRIERIHLVLASADFAQILYSVVALVAVDVVNLLLWPTAFAYCPNGMMQINMNQFLAYPAIYA